MRFAAALLAALVAFTAPLAALADIRSVVYPTENPTSNDANSNAQLQRLSTGAFMRDALGITAEGSGTYANLACSPGTGLYVTVAPRVAGSNGVIYQVQKNNPNPLPTGGYASPLPADTTDIMLPGLQAATTAPLGPLTAPGGGLSTYYLIEAQVASSVPSTPQQRTFVSTSGSRSVATVNVQNIDSVSWQVKAGTPGATPAVPATDAGWVAVCTTLIPNGRTQVQAGDIAAAAGFTGGFVQGANVVHVSALATPVPDTGNASISGQFSALVATGTAPFVVNSTTTVANLTAQYATALSPAPTPSASAPIVQAGTFPNLVYSCPTCVTTLVPGANIVISPASGPTPTVAVTNSPSFSGTVTAANATVSTTLTLSALASGCLQVNGAGVVSVTGCGGTVAFNATTPLVVATPAGQANFTCPTCVVSVTAGDGTIVIGGTATAPTAKVTAAPTFTTVTAATVNVTGLSASLPVCTDGSKNLSTSGCAGGGVTSVSGSAPIASSGGTTPAISCSTCVTSVGAGTGISSSGGTTPTIAITTVPVANGGTGTASPSLVPGTGISISGSWPNQTITSAAGVAVFTSCSIVTPNASCTLTVAYSGVTSYACSGSLDNVTGSPSFTPTTPDGLFFKNAASNSVTVTLSNTSTVAAGTAWVRAICFGT